MKRLWTLLFAALCLSAAGLYAEAPGAVAIRNARIVPVSGPAIPRGMVVIRNGLIESVGAGVTVPADAWIVEGEGLTVYPGLVDALSTIGIPDAAAATPVAAGRGGTATPAIPFVSAQPTTPPARGPEDRPSTSSWLRAADLVRTSDRRIESARSAGFTTAISFPHRGIFAGQGAVIDLAGEKAGQMVVADNVGQYITTTTAGFGAGYPASLLGAIAYIRQIYLDADHYQKAKQFYAAHSRGTPRPEYDRALEGVLESPRILLPASRRVDVERMLHFAAELKLQAVLYGVPEGYHSADLLKNANTAVLVSLKWPEKPRDGDPEQVDSLKVLEIRDKAPSTAAALSKNAVRFAFYADGLERRADLFRAVKRAIDAGLSQDDAVRAMTLAPAEIFGVADRLGSIEKGKIANLVVTKGDLFQDRTEVKYIFVDGNKFEPVDEPAATPSGPRGQGAEGNRFAPPDLPVRTPVPPQGENQ